MNEILPYLLSSAICLLLLYLPFRLLMRKEALFNVNRLVLLIIVVCSLAIPGLILPGFVQKPVEIQDIPFFTQNQPGLNNLPGQEKSAVINSALVPETASQQGKITTIQVLSLVYAAGVLISLLMLLHGIFLIIQFYKDAERIKLKGSLLLIVKKDIPAFSFAHLIFISRNDYENHSSVILAHELEHVRLNHFYDLMFLETVKILFWFNPVIWLLIRDMKDIHEFQADHHLLNKGIDAKKYQLLIIQKSVGSGRFALANSFNQFQIKKRITMMNIQKTSTTWIWKVAVFIPVIILLLLTFGRQESISKTADHQDLKGNTVTGTVVFSDGKPLAKIGIRVHGTTITTLTDKEGKFKLEDIPDKANLQIFVDGFKWQELKADYKSPMTIKLDPGVFLMGRVKVVGHVKDPPKPLGKGFIVPKNSGKTPLCILDSVTTDLKRVNELDDYYTINLLSSKAGIEKYGLRGKNGVVEVNTIKKIIFPTKNSQVHIEMGDFKYDTKLDSAPSKCIIDEKPEFIGEKKELMEFIADNLIYPAIENKKQERIKINFTVNKSGKIEQVKVKNSGLPGLESPSLEAEASRIFSLMPKWSPGKKNGRPVDVPCYFDMDFILQ